MHDEFIFDLSELAILISNRQPTKRHIVGIAMKFYDPIGFVSPIIICFKMLFQELCTSKISWDEPLSAQPLNKWRQLVSGFQGITTSIPRCYFALLDKVSSQCSFKEFCDVSSGAYVAVVNLKIKNGTGSIVNFVVPKHVLLPPVNSQYPD